MSNKKYRKYAVTTMAAAAAVASVAPVATAAETTEFKDVNKNHDFYSQIMELTEKGIITGFEDGTFRPVDHIKRVQVANMIIRAQQLSAPTDSEVEEILKDFDDVDANSEYAKEIATAAKAGIFEGQHGNFAPWKEITREQMASVLVRAYDLKKYDTGEKVDINLKGVDESHKDNVQVLANLGITQGTALEDFKPIKNITRGQFAAQMSRTFEAIKKAEEQVDPEIVSVSAITSNSVKVTLTGNVGDLTAKDFKIVGDGLSVVKVDQSGHNATIELNKDMTDGAEYTLQLVDEEENVLSEAGFKYELDEVASIALSKSAFEVGEKVTDFLKVLDKNGVEISSADYNILEVQSSNTDVIENDNVGTVKTEGTANVRFKVEYKDGSYEWSDFITVNVEQAITAELAGYHLANDTTDVYPNTVAYLKQENADGDFTPSKTILYESDTDKYLQVYADDSKGNPETKALDLSTNSDYEVKSLDTNVATLTQDNDGVKLNYVAPGEARILVTGKDGYKKTITVKVSEDPVYKDLVLGATSLNLSDEVLTEYTTGLTNGEDGVTEDTVELSWKDQNGDLQAFNLTSSTENDDAIVVEDAIKNGDKLVISTANTNGAFDLKSLTNADAKTDLLSVEANQDKETKNASIRVSYYEDKTANKPTTQKVISTTVADIDASKPAADYQTLVDNSAIDPNNPLSDTATVTAYAVDKDGNRVGNVTEEITLTANESVSRSELSWFDIATRNAGTVIPGSSTADNQVTFIDDAEYFMTESGAIKVNYTVAGASDPHGTVTLSYDNSFAAPDKTKVDTKPIVVDFSDDLMGEQISVNNLLFGKINGVNDATNNDSADLVIDLDSGIYNGTDGKSTIAIKKGKTGYATKPILSFIDNNGKTIGSGAALYGLDLGKGSIPGNGYVVDKTDGTYYDDATFDVKYSISNAKNLEQDTSQGNLGNKLSITAGEDQASFTIVVTEVTVKGDPRKDNSGYTAKKNLLDSPKSIDVILKSKN